MVLMEPSDGRERKLLICSDTLWFHTLEQKAEVRLPIKDKARENLQD